MLKDAQKSNAKKYYWYGILTIIPIAGLVIGILLLRKGIIIKDRLLSLIGIFGVIITGLFFVGSLFFSFYSKLGQAKRVELAQYSLNEVMRDVEFYKVQFGYYPDSLQELKFVDNRVFIMDPLSQKEVFSKKLEYLRYKRINSSHYTLFSAGIDHIPHTSDDVYPFVPNSSKSGLIKK
jgi:hypothetical protein